MPGLVRKLLIYAAVDGLVIQPLVQKGQRSALAVKVTYRGGSIGPALADGSGDIQGKAFEAFGVVGLLAISSSSYLISITRRQVVAQVYGKSVYVITEVALTPLSSKKEAEAAIARTQSGLKRGAVDGHDLDDDTYDEEGDFSAAASDDIEDEDAHLPEVSDVLFGGTTKDADRRLTSSVAKDVIAKKGGYGRFAQGWFSRAGWTAGQRRNLGLSSADTDTVTNVPVESVVPNDRQNLDASREPSAMTEPETVKPHKGRDVAATLLPKLLRTTQVLFGSSRGFFFSYDYDITRSATNRKPLSESDTPLHKQVDPLFFWNRHVIQPFIDAGQYSLVLPVMQGFVGQRAFVVDKHPVVNLDNCLNYGPLSVIEMKELSSDDEYERLSQSGTTTVIDVNKPPKPSQSFEGSKYMINTAVRRSTSVESTRSYLLTLISRRSVKRSGLRYLRRGVDGEGNTANTVETEQILSNPDWSQSSKVYSFLQVRGSIPLFFSQSPYSFKPVPQMQQSVETNLQALRAHFTNLSLRYGSLQVASLVEKHNTEAQVGEEFEKIMASLNESGGVNGNKVGFEWFDFHAVCRGMKFENVSLLLDSLGPALDSFGNSVEIAGELTNRQSGILRTNCMDCLDRTNVVQSACGRRALEIQLKDQGIDLSSQADQVQQWFNTLWADNGDAISKQYASTAAMKGDFTRTRKRDYKGALTDMGISIARFYSGIVNDYFSQAAIDFLLGNVTSLVFEDFEANMMSSDPVISMQKMRQQAIDVSQRLIVADQSEELVGGWALLAPREPNTIKSMPFEELVLLLTNAALYTCRFDWNMEKVSSFERVDLRHIIGIKYGTYITSTLSPAQADEKTNIGLVVTYRAGANDIERVNTRSLSTAPSRKELDPHQGSSVSASLSGLFAAVPNKKPSRIVALKALPTRSAVAATVAQDELQMSETEQVKHVCSEIERLVLASQGVDAGAERMSILEEGNIISLAEARQSTGLLDHLGHSLKKLVWA